MSLSADLAWSHTWDLPEWLSRLRNCSLLMRFIFQQYIGVDNPGEGRGKFGTLALPGSSSEAFAPPVSHAGPCTPMQPRQRPSLPSACNGSSECTSVRLQIMERKTTWDSGCPSRRGDTRGCPDLSVFSLGSVFSPVLASWPLGPHGSSSSCLNGVIHCLENISRISMQSIPRAIEFKPKSYWPMSAPPLLAVISGAAAPSLQDMQISKGQSTSKSELGRCVRMPRNFYLIAFLPYASSQAGSYLS